MEEFLTFYEKQRKKLFSYLLRMTGDYYLSMDLVQESFTRYLEKYADVTRNISLLYTIARNGFLDHKRRYGRQVEFEQEHESKSGDLGETVEIKQEYKKVLSAMERLDEDEREILSMILSGDMNYKEIASLIGTTEGNVKVKVHRARVKLKKILQSGGAP